LEESEIKAVQQQKPPVNMDMSNNNDDNMNPKRIQTTAGGRIQQGPNLFLLKEMSKTTRSKNRSQST
jgi:hypothetical protein